MTDPKAELLGACLDKDNYPRMDSERVSISCGILREAADLIERLRAEAASTSARGRARGLEDAAKALEFAAEPPLTNAQIEFLRTLASAVRALKPTDVPDDLKGKPKADAAIASLGLTPSDLARAIELWRAEKAGSVMVSKDGLKDCVAHLVGAVSSYENFAGNSKRAGVRDALYSTRLSDYRKAVDRARNLLVARPNPGASNGD